MWLGFYQIRLVDLYVVFCLYFLSLYALKNWSIVILVSSLGLSQLKPSKLFNSIYVHKSFLLSHTSCWSFQRCSSHHHLSSLQTNTSLSTHLSMHTNTNKTKAPYAALRSQQRRKTQIHTETDINNILQQGASAWNTSHLSMFTHASNHTHNTSDDIQSHTHLYILCSLRSHSNTRILASRKQQHLPFRAVTL